MCQRLQSDVAKRQTAYLKKLLDAVTKAESTYQIKSDALLDYSKRKGVDVLKTRYEIEKVSLIALNDDYTRADVLASSAEQRYEAIKKAKTDGKDVPLSAELQESVENDSTLKALVAARLNWELEKALVESKKAPDTVLADVNTRLKKLDEQIAETRKTLTDDARQRLEKMLQDEAANKRFEAEYIGHIRKAKEDIVTGIGQDLLDWQKRMDDLKEQQDLVSKLHSQYNLADANRAADDIRVEQLDDPVVPEKPSWPAWDTYMPEGVAGGLVLGLVVAGLLACRRGCRDQGLPAAPSGHAAAQNPPTA